MGGGGKFKKKHSSSFETLCAPPPGLQPDGGGSGAAVSNIGNNISTAEISLFPPHQIYLDINNSHFYISSGPTEKHRFKGTLSREYVVWRFIFILIDIAFVSNNGQQNGFVAILRQIAAIFLNSALTL